MAAGDSCCGVVDVAGGRGDLSFELHSLRHVPCTVVDPRPPNFDKTLVRFKATALNSEEEQKLQMACEPDPVDSEKNLQPIPFSSRCVTGDGNQLLIIFLLFSAIVFDVSQSCTRSSGESTE